MANSQGRYLYYPIQYRKDQDFLFTVLINVTPTTVFGDIIVRDCSGRLLISKIGMPLCRKMQQGSLRHIFI